MSRHPWNLLLIVCLLTGALPAQELSSAQQSTETASQMLGVPAESLVEAHVKVFEFPALGISVTAVKARDRRGEILSVAQDANGDVVDLASLRSQEAAARAQTPAAKLQPALAQLMTVSPLGDRIPVVIWLHFDDVAMDAYAAQQLEGHEGMTEQELRAAEAAVTAHNMSRNAEVTASFVPWLGGSLGLVPGYVSTSAPAIFVEATQAEIMQIAAQPAVNMVFVERFDRTDTNNDANATHRTYRVHNFGVKGRGIRAAVLENNGIDPACPWLNVTAWFNAGTPNPDNHVHGTSGCIASQLGSRLGSAPDVDLYSANAASYSDTNITAAGDWIATQNIDLTNMSFGGSGGAQEYLDRYFNYQSRFYQDSFVASAGNNGLGNTVGSPGQAYNCITVGSFANNDDGDWTGDAMSSFSSTQDPNTGCEKPNVAAVGSTVDTLGDGTTSSISAGCPGISVPGPWLVDNYCGTSFSSPHAAGNLANAMVADSSAIVSPEAAMAAMMATAWHNIEGSSRLSEQDGAGGIHGLAAYRCAAANHIRYTTVTSGSFSTNGYYTYNISLTAGDRTRVCIAWGANANNTYTSSQLDADLDLAVYLGSNVTSGSSFGFSSSFNNNFEIIEFTPLVTGTYTVRVNDFTFDGTSERLGIAWSQKYTDGASARLREFTTEESPTAGPTIGASSYYMDFVCPNSPSAPYVCFPSGTLGAGYMWPSQMNWDPLNIDIWTTLFFDHLSSGVWFWSGYLGTLSSSGTTLSNRMWLLNWPSLVGFPLHHIGLTGEVGLPDDIKELTEIHTFYFWPQGNAWATPTDDGSFTQALPFGFPFFGNTYNQCHVNANGNITFGNADTDWTESAAQMLSEEPRIAGLWDDLAPHQDGTVQVREIFQGTQHVVVEYTNLPQLSQGDDNTVRITMFDNGTIKIEHRDVDLDDCIVGISPGNGLSSSSSIDITSNGNRVSNGATYQQFTASDPFDLHANSGFWFNSVTFTPTNAGATSYRMTIDIDP